MSGGERAAFWIIDGAWCAWLVLWVVLAGWTKTVIRRESAGRRLAHLAPMGLAGALLLAGVPGTLLMRPILPRAAWMAYLGLAVTCAGLGFTIWARLVLAGNWSGVVTLKQDHELVRRGPYGIVRHPIYTGLLGGMLGTAIAIDQWRGPVSVCLLAAAFLGKMRTEETFMREAFGADYDAYRRDVPALVPFLL